MTGYGQARWQGPECSVVAEVRSVNGRFLKVTSRLPTELAAGEREAEKLVRERIRRGSVDLRVRMDLSGAAAARPVNRKALASYVRDLQAVGEKLGTPLAFNADALMNLPGVLVTDEVADEERAALIAHTLAAVGQALDDLNGMRAAEGANLHDELLSHLDAAERLADQVEAGHPEAHQQYVQRLIGRVNRLLQDSDIVVGEQEVAREAAIHAERSSVCEEMARLRSHLEQFRDALEQAKPVGRRLEFIAQEMHREVNTMGSKVADASLSKTVIDLHSVVDNIREQVLNVE